MALEKNMKAIQTTTVGPGGAPNIEFNTIPQTYTDLILVISARHTTSETSNDILVTLNGSTTTFSGVRVYGSGTVASSDTNSRTIGTSVGASATANVFGSSEVLFANYTSSNYKVFGSDQVGENDASLAYQILSNHLWSTSSPITSITIAPASGSFVYHTSATLYGVTRASQSAMATGGTIYQDADYFYHVFAASGTFTPTANMTVDYLVVAGGGGGGAKGGGGGAGGLRSTVTATGGGGSLESALSLTNGTAYTVTVGAGGTASTTTIAGGDGVNSSISGTGITTVTSTGGGGGGTDSGSEKNGRTGGSGGGAAGGGYSPSGTGGARTASPVQGFAGAGNVGSPPYNGGGGGGAGAVGIGTASAGAAVGGIGVQITAFATPTGTGVNNGYYAGGGGGGWDSANAPSGADNAGGLGGGGLGKNTEGVAGISNTGGGGGAGGYTATGSKVGAKGGSGIVIVRYVK